jgi:succinate dehydrogenase / fumarate reductase cytochrome b subunit
MRGCGAGLLRSKLSLAFPLFAVAVSVVVVAVVVAVTVVAVAVAIAVVVAGTATATADNTASTHSTDDFTATTTATQNTPAPKQPRQRTTVQFSSPTRPSVARETTKPGGTRAGDSMSQSYERGLVEDFGRWREFSAGMWAWVFHKFTGWVLVGYLFTHIAVLSTALQSPEAYGETIRTLESLLLVRLLEIGLLAVAVFHILNGLRLLLVDLGVGLEAQDKAFYASLGLTGAIVVASVPTFLAGVF